MAKIIILNQPSHTVSPLTPNTEQQSGSPVHLIPFIYYFNIYILYFIISNSSLSGGGTSPPKKNKKGPLLAQGALCIRGTQLYRGAKGTQPDPGSRSSAPNSAVSLRTILFIFWGGEFRNPFFRSHLRPSCIPVSFLFFQEFRDL